MMIARFWIVRTAALLLALAPIGASAEQGVANARIVFGQATALEGPAAALGHAARSGILAAFTEANANGGVGGRKLELISRNDNYEPETSVVVTRRLINEDHVFALVGALGTSTALATAPIAQETGVPFVGPFTGAEFLREAGNGSVVNLHPSYFEEAQFAVDHLIKDRGITRVGIFYQDDSYGYAGLAGLTRALAKHGLRVAAEGSFVRNTLAVKVALATIRKANPQAVIMIAPYRPCAEFIKLARELNFAPLFVGNSFTGLDALAEELGVLGTGVFLPQAVPIPRGQTIPAVSRYRAALSAADPTTTPDAVGFEGYLLGRVIIAALRAAGEQPTREAFLAAIFGHKFDIDGIVFDFTHRDNQAAPHLSLAVIGADGLGKNVAGMDQSVQ